MPNSSNDLKYWMFLILKIVIFSLFILNKRSYELHKLKPCPSGLLSIWSSSSTFLADQIRAPLLYKCVPQPSSPVIKTSPPDVWTYIWPGFCPYLDYLGSLQEMQHTLLRGRRRTIFRPTGTEQPNVQAYRTGGRKISRSKKGPVASL